VARFEGTAQLFDQAPLQSSARFAPLQNFKDFQLTLRTPDSALTRVNDVAAASGKFDFKAGSGYLVFRGECHRGVNQRLYKAPAARCGSLQLDARRARRGQGFFPLDLEKHGSAAAKGC
jgi:hypothetical protein